MWSYKNNIGTIVSIKMDETSHRSFCKSKPFHCFLFTKIKENCIIATYILSLCATTCTCSNILVNDKIISNQRGFSYPYVQIFVSRPFSTCSLPPFLMVVRKLFSRWSNPTKINTSILHLEITRLFLWLSDDAIFLVLTCYKLKNLFFGRYIFVTGRVVFLIKECHVSLPREWCCYFRDVDRSVRVWDISNYQND